MFEIGSLIKHQLVAHLGLGVALRSVLDALRKSIDSKVSWYYLMNLYIVSIMSVNFYVTSGLLVAWWLQMFMFGTTALEQFMDRVIEWPQYCNHILQISHLRGTHAELVSAIEQALAKISSSQNEPNIGNIFSVDPHGSGSPSIGNTEVYSHCISRSKVMLESWKSCNCLDHELTLATYYLTFLNTTIYLAC